MDYLINTSTTNPWRVIGGFNAILVGKEKLSTRPPSSLFVKDFNDLVFGSGLKDLGFKGNYFAGANNKQGQAFVAATLDCAFSNVRWMDTFEDPMVHHLPKIASSNNPLLFFTKRLQCLRTSHSNSRLCGCLMDLLLRSWKTVGLSPIVELPNTS